MKQLTVFLFLIILALAIELESIAFIHPSNVLDQFVLAKKDSDKDKEEKDKGKDKNKQDKDDDSEKEKKKEKVQINEADFSLITLGQLLAQPGNYIGKKVKLTGAFSSFTTLALDYKPAFRDSKEYISITIFRPKTEIPLSELKMAYSVEEAKDNELIKDIDEGDTLEIFGEVFSAALDEPWLDIVYMKKIADANPDEEKKEVAETKKNVEEQESSKKDKKDKQKTNNNNDD